MIASLAICTVLYIAVAGVLTGMVHWQQINIEAPVAVAFLDRGLTTRREHHYAGRAGWADQRDAGDVAGPDARALFDGQ